MSKFGALALEVEKPSRMTQRHPVTGLPLVDKNGKEGYIDLYSRDSEVARNYLRAAAKRRLERRNRSVMTVHEIESDELGLLVVLTAGWYLLGLDGKPGQRNVDGQTQEICFGCTPLGVEFTPENARELYAEQAVAWLYEDADRFAGTRENFLPASSKTSLLGQTGSSGGRGDETTGPLKRNTPQRETA